MKLFLYTLIFFSTSFRVFSQDTLCFWEPSPEFRQHRFLTVVGVQASGYGGSLALLGSAWYRNYDQTLFHSFDDSREWLQMDKAGHLTTSFYLSRIGIEMFEWSGVNKKKAMWYGAASSFLYLSGIELLDGFSDGWGFSLSDLASNTLGTGFALGKKYIENEKPNSGLLRGIGGTSLKFSFHQTAWSDLRPSLLGSNWQENILKDYNGQSYWLSFNPSSFLRSESKFPKWLNIALGYGGEGMISGHPEYVALAGGGTIWVERYRQYYFSLDIDLTKIKTRSHFLKTVFSAFSFIKIPAPAIEMSKKGMKFHSFYY